jgi:hypothetical protein
VGLASKVTWGGQRLVRGGGPRPYSCGSGMLT